MNWMIVHFSLSLFLFQATDSKIPQALDTLQAIIKELEYENATLFNTNRETILKIDQLVLKGKKSEFRNGFYDHLNAISTLKLNISKHIMKMMGHVEKLRYSIMESLKKENQHFDEFDPAEDMDINDFLRLSLSDRLLQEYTTCLIQLKILKSEVYRLNEECCVKAKTNNDVEKVLDKFLDGKNIPEISPDDVNYEDPPLPFDDKAGTAELERLQRIALTIKDQLYEMPKLENEDGDDVKSEKIHSTKVSSEAPRWLRTEKDIEEIRVRYIKWTPILGLEDSQKLTDLKEKIKKNGFSIKFFIKTLAEYYNLTTILLECSLKDDAECLEMVNNYFDEERFEKIPVIFQEWKGLDSIPF